jgi:two-component system sensor histidine kinase/response regulator
VDAHRMLAGSDSLLSGAFAIGHADATRDIRAALVAGRRADAERVAHTLKSVAGTIGARQLHGEAGEVEAAFRGGATPVDVAPLLDAAERTLDDLIRALLCALPPEPKAAPRAASVEPQALAAAVGQLEELLSSDAAEAVDAFEATAPILAPAFGERAAKIGELVRDYRFEDALVAALREAARR